MIKKKYAGLADMELPACPCGIVRRTEWIDDQDGERLRLTICQPEESMDNMPCLVYFHGGGFCLGDAPYIHENVAQYAKEANCMVVFVHYRTSDRYPFPVPFMDCYTALEYVREHCEPWHIDRKRIAVGGDSAGGALAAACAIRSRECGKTDICFQMLVYPVMDARMRTESMKKYTDSPIWNARLTKRMWEIYLRNGDMGKRCYASPLKPGTRVALIGDFAFDPRYQGAGSSMVNVTKLDKMSELIHDYDLNVVGMAKGYVRTGKTDAVMEKEAVSLAQSADVVLYCFGLDEPSESEGVDRTHMRIPQNQISLLESLARVNENIVGILSAGAAVEMPWQTSLKALLHGYLYGQASAGAMLDILTGKINPSGRLNETYPVRYEDTPAFKYFPSEERNSEYREALYVGYRYYDTAKVRVLYPFGFGLSYTEFEYSNLTVDETGVEFDLTNTGDVDGAEVAQLYIGMKDAKVFQPDKELKGFQKVFLKAGESRHVRIPFDDKTFRYWNVRTNRWEVEGGTYTIMIGASCLDIRLTAEVDVEGTTETYPYYTNRMPSYYFGLISQVEDSEFRELLGYPIPSGKWSGDLTVNDAICQMYYAKSPIARFAYNKLTKMKKKSEEAGKPDLNILFIYNMPFRAIAKMTGGMVSMEMVEGIVTMVNGHFFKGLGHTIAGFFRNQRQNQKYVKKITGKGGK